MKRILPFIGIVLLCLNCQNDDDNPENSAIPEEESCEMQFDDLGLTVANEIFFAEQAGWTIDDTPWKGRYSDNIIELSFEGNCGPECGAKAIFVFNKIGNCIDYNYYYTVYNQGGNIFDTRSISESFLLYELTIQEYIEDRLFVGRISNTHQNEIYNIDFWIELNEDDYFTEEVPEYTSFQDCLGSQTPFNIDVSNDNNPDYSIIYNEEIIQYHSYEVPYLKSEINFTSTNPNNTILGYFDNFNGAFYGGLQTTVNGTILSEDFTSESDSVYIGEYHDFIGESEYPYKQYNIWTGREWNIYDNPGILSDWYIVVKMILNGEPHYGYINFSILGNDCEIVIHETYLNPTPNEHITIE
ncbi:hypothetical protein [Hanstruepera flava]|uniref:hypothetical protein n=1 Tax=Hanstruepera flava TaxID=2930218 RepID=UPI0020287059|nr:hypothetical protein [Hanstruepera flava]